MPPFIPQFSGRRRRRATPHASAKRNAASSRPPAPPHREIRFAAQGQVLSRPVCLPDGRQYTQHATLPVFKEVARYIEENPRTRLSVELLRRALPELPFTQTQVALAFLRERGVLTPD